MASSQQREAPVRVLVVAGSDSSAGAGIQADIKTVMALGGYAMTAITALTAQNTQGVQAVSAVDPFFVEQQIQSVLSDTSVDTIKIGMLASAHTAELVARQLESKARGVPVVLDPVLRSSSGTPLYPGQALETLIQRLVPQCALLTPNIPEAEALAGIAIKEITDMQRAADRLLLLGASAVLIKGSHLQADTITDLLRTADGLERKFEGPRISSRNTHGTGCTLASAIATYLAHGFTLESAVAQAREYVVQAIERALPLGKGNGPLDHAWPRYYKAEN